MKLHSSQLMEFLNRLDEPKPGTSLSMAFLVPKPNGIGHDIIQARGEPSQSMNFGWDITLTLQADS